MGSTHTLIRGVFDKALSNICGWIIPSGVQISSGLWTVICGFTPVSSFLRQEKLLMAARLRVGDFKAARIFRGLLKSGGGSFERDVKKALTDWSLTNSWNEISKDNVQKFKKKVKRIAKKQWPRGASSSPAPSQRHQHGSNVLPSLWRRVPCGRPPRQDCRRHRP